MFNILREREFKSFAEPSFSIYSQRLGDVLDGKIHYTDISDHCSVLDPVELFNICQELIEEVNYQQLENFVLEEFLQANDPKLLIGLDEDDILGGLKKLSLQPTPEGRLIKFDEGEEEEEESRNRRNQSCLDLMSLASARTTKKSGFSTITLALQAKNKEFRLNYKKKNELTKKICLANKSKIKAMEQDLFRETKRMKALMESIHYEISETEELYKSFENNVVVSGTNFYTGVISSEQFLRFLKQVINSSVTTCSQMRLQSTNLQNEIISKSKDYDKNKEISGIISEIDFQKILMEKDKEIKKYNQQSQSVKFVTKLNCKVKYVLNLRKQNLVKLEQDYKKILTKIEEVTKRIKIIEKEMIPIEEEIYTAEQSLRKLQDQIEVETAPATNDYISLKGKLVNLEKERKTLKHKIYLLNVRLTNAIQKSKIHKKRAIKKF